MTSLLVDSCPGQKNTSKNVFERFNKIRHRRYGTKKTQEWLSANISNFISKEEWPPSSPNLNLLDFGILGYLESKVSAIRHKSLEKKRNDKRNGRKCPKMRFVTLAGHFRGVLRLLQIIFEVFSACN